MRFSSLGSGSEGNALLIESGDGARTSRILIDCGFRLREVEKRLRSAGVEPGDLDGILVTHEHSDHVGGVFRLSRAHQIPVFITHGTLRGSAGDTSETVSAGEAAHETLVRVVTPDQSFEVAGLQIMPVAVPHDAREPVQFVVCDGRVRLGVLTDIGHGTSHVQRAYSGVDALVLECNHDRELLAANARYPEVLKRRISGPWGHLANDAAAEILSAIERNRLRRVVAAHLSRQNNTPELARRSLAAVLGANENEVDVADQDSGLSWIEL
jgi:phosphoribosyl 1,2-cyclic phosphodiesterase